MFGPIIRTILSSEWHGTKHKCSSWILYSSTADYIAMQCPSRLHKTFQNRDNKSFCSVVYNSLCGNTETLC